MELTTTLICRTSNRESHSLPQMLPHFGQTASSKLHSHPEDDIRSLQEKSYRTEICFFRDTKQHQKASKIVDYIKAQTEQFPGGVPTSLFKSGQQWDKT